MTGTQRRTLDEFCARQRQRLDRRLDECVARARHRKATLERTIENERVEQIDAPSVDALDLATEPVDEDVPSYDNLDFEFRKGITMAQNANTINRPGPAAQYPSRPNTNVPPPSPVAINGTVVPRS